MITDNECAIVVTVHRIQARSQAYSHTPGSTSILKNENCKWPKNGVKLES